MSLQGVKQNPEASREDLRRMSLILNELVARENSGSITRLSQVSTGTSVTDDGLFSIYYINSTSNVTFNLKSLVDVQGRELRIYKLDGSTSVITLTPASTSQLINGSSLATITAQFQSRELHARDLTNWNY